MSGTTTPTGSAIVSEAEVERLKRINSRLRRRNERRRQRISHLASELALAEEDADQARSEADELRYAPWPEWASKCKRIIREHSGYDGYDDVDGIDLPQELEEQLNEYLAHSRREAVHARVERETKRQRDEAKHYRAQASDLRAKLAAAAEDERDRLAGEMERAEARAAKAVEVLRRPDVQWGATYHDEMGCPVCSGSSGSHMTGCELATVISNIPGYALELDVVKEARFLLERIRELGGDAFTEDGYRDFAGHVAPSMARLATLLSDHPAQEAGVEAGEVRRAALEEAAQVIEADNTAGYGEHRNMAIASAVSEHHAAAIRALQIPANGGRDGK